MWMGNSVKWASTDWEKYGNWIHWPQKYSHKKKLLNCIHKTATTSSASLTKPSELSSSSSYWHQFSQSCICAALIAQHSMQIDAEEAAQRRWWWGCEGREVGEFSLFANFLQCWKIFFHLTSKFTQQCGALFWWRAILHNDYVWNNRVSPWKRWNVNISFRHTFHSPQLDVTQRRRVSRA